MTIITQIGGIVYVVYQPLSYWLKKRWNGRQQIQNKAIKKIFIEPHLKTRWGLKNYQKIRYHGCHAVRHDDHIHVQL